MRLCGLGSRSAASSACAGSLSSGSALLCSLPLCARICVKRAAVSLPVKGNSPVSRRCITTPAAHSSTCGPYTVFSVYARTSSGAKYCGVPQAASIQALLRRSVARPRSMRYRLSRSPGRLSMRLAGLMSLCAMPRLCRMSMPSSRRRISALASSSPQMCPAASSSSRLLPSIASITMCSWSPASKQECTHGTARHACSER
mmetsp:Transcript_36723/g.95391  ORF Transcript_36723/g.95391 Transcript_36723/m.95391 type:complete len:201 (+) Transcript_36723:377-979(+)